MCIYLFNQLMDICQFLICHMITKLRGEEVVLW